MGGSDPNTAVLTAGNAAKNNVFCGGLCIAAVVVAISAAYSAYAGGGNPLAGLDVIAEGKDPIQKMLSTGVAKSVAFSYSRYPNATATVLHTLGDAIDTAGVWVRIVDDKTGNVISDAWDQIPPEYRKKIIGLADLGEMGVTLYVSASAMAKVIQGVKVAKDAGKAVTLGVDAAKGASLPQPGVLTAIEKQVAKTGVTGNWSISGVGSAQFVETTTVSVGKVTYRVQKKLDGYVIAIGPDGEKYVFRNHSLEGTSAGTLHTKWNERKFYEQIKKSKEFLSNTKSLALNKKWQKLIYTLSTVAKLMMQLNK
ncbi:hypothetical protein [Varunaivibrio sulfuroxidans]|uniref:hypothetical protein n=1 Tax=Varunaivibrio sulfuroxidans TaxID=1773489 RepID=UPI0023E103A7|nr:hypothetical protein [Varunaivibrio sulfuroxidans]WES32010.1 hypothetical protein P3M64_06550 [Varunaivibrio sulfuroxidans]